MFYGPTLSELDRRTRAKLSESGVEFFTSQNVLDWLNEAQDVVCDRFPWTVPTTWRLSDTAPGKASYLAPTEAIRVDHVVTRLASGVAYVLDEKPEGWMVTRKSFNSGGTGIPRNVAFSRSRDGIAMELYPVADRPYPLIVKGYCRPTPLTALTDRTDVPPEVVQALVWYALWQAKLKDEEDSGAQLAERGFEKAMRDLQTARFVENVRLKQTAYGKSYYPTPGWMAGDGGMIP